MADTIVVPILKKSTITKKQRFLHYIVFNIVLIISTLPCLKLLALVLTEQNQYAFLLKRQLNIWPHIRGKIVLDHKNMERMN